MYNVCIHICTIYQARLVHYKKVLIAQYHPYPELDMTVMYIHPTSKYSGVTHIYAVAETSEQMQLR